MAEKKGTEIRQEEIVSAALTLVANQGVRSMTIERIANMVGIVPSAIFTTPGKPPGVRLRAFRA